MGGNNSDGDSGSDSHSSGSKSPSRSRSATPKATSQQGTPRSRNSGSDRSRSGTPQSRSHSGSPKSRRSSSAAHSARSGSATSQRSAVSNRSKTPHSSPTEAKRTPPASAVEPESDDSRSQSPNLQIDDRANSRSRSRSASGSESRHSRSRSKSSSAERRKSRSSSGGSSRSSRSGTPHSHKSNSSHSGSESEGHLKTKDLKRKVKSGSEAENDDALVKKEFEDAVVKAKKSRIIDSESEPEEEPAKQIDAQDIFGDADDISVSDEDEKKSDVSERGSQRNRRSRSSSRESRHSRSRSRTPRSRSVSQQRADIPPPPPKEDEVEPIPETRIDVEIPRIVTDLGKEIHFVKLPNFLSVDTRPFDNETYEDEIDEEETMDEEGRQRIKLKVSNTIRWREFMNNDGEMVKESNARFVRWSDGSLTLHLGNETFDVYRQPLHGDHNHMFIRQGTGLQGQAVFRTKLTFRPHSTESFTHKKMTMSLADRSQKTSGIKILTQVGKDPTTDRLYNLKKEEEKLRQAMRAQHKPQPKKKKLGAHASHGDGTHSYLHDEGSDDENVISLSAIKNKYKKGTAAATSASTGGGSDQKASAIYSSDDDEGSDFEGRRKKVDKAKGVKALRDDSDSDSDVARSGNRKQAEDSHTENEVDEEDGGTKSGSEENISGTEN